jgi:alpha-methylacyl-CoA racemase
MHSKLLSGFTIIDFSHRLPGPLAGLVLSSLGATVIKIEDEVFKDPFLDGAFNAFDPSFKDWYETLNEGKRIVRLNFNSPTIKEEIKQYLQMADGCLNSLPLKLKLKLGLDEQTLQSYNLPLAFVELESSSTVKKSMHDLNALGLTGLLDLHIEGNNDDIINPPFLPVSGIAFGQHSATTLLAAILKAKKQNTLIMAKSYLHDTAELIFTPFWPLTTRKAGRKKFLHNGLFPCYAIYKTKDKKHIAVACVEEKFYEEVRQLFQIELSTADRFNKDQHSFEIVAQAIKKVDSSTIKKWIEEKDLCLTIIEQV